MAYQALYRVWRSQRFDDIVGQKAVTQTLKNAIVSHKTSHAYLFTGPRGTGKTSAAKIFAKAINCLNSTDGEPCNECEMCRSITAGSQEDVIEIDAASNNGVEEIRFIRDRANYAPTKAAYKVYIIDEVHMLSTGAFNALLKTLEEPKEHVIFILATTEPHKIPATIISRTQRFDFKRINPQDIVEHLAYIMETTNLPYEEQALGVIARAAEGGMRDALSILDQAISFSNGTVTMTDAMQVTGSLTYEMMDRYLSACVDNNVSAALEALESILSEGKEARRFLEDLLQYCRDLLMFQQAPKLLEEKSAHLTETFKQLSGRLSAAQLFEMIKILSDTQNDIRFTNSTTIYLEVATVKLAQGTSKGISLESSTEDVADGQLPVPADSSQVQELKQQLATLKTELDQLKQALDTNGHSGTQPTKTVKPKPAASQFRVPKERVFTILSEATRQNLDQVREIWNDLLMSLTVTQRAMLKSSEPVAASPKGIVLSFEYEIICQKATNDQELQVAVQNYLSRVITDYTPETVCIPKESWPEVRQTFLKQSKQQGKPIDPIQESDELDLPPDPEEEGQQIVDKAEQLFGSSLVTVVDD